MRYRSNKLYTIHYTLYNNQKTELKHTITAFLLYPLVTNSIYQIELNVFFWFVYWILQTLTMSSSELSALKSVELRCGESHGFKRAPLLPAG